MKVILIQSVKISGDSIPYNWSKTYESDIVPVVGMEIEDPLWKDPGRYKIMSCTINYYENAYYVWIEEYNYEIPLSRKQEIADMAKLHGWKANWDY